MTAVRILRLMPGLLNLNGSLGNTEVLATRASWFGAEVSVEDIEPGVALADRPDIVTIAHGTSSTLATAAAALRHWSGTLAGWHREGVLFFGAGLGGDLLGQSVSDSEGTVHPGVGLTTTHTQLGGHRFSGEVAGRDARGRESAGYLNDHSTRVAGADAALITIDTPGLGQWTGATGPQSEGTQAPKVWVSALSGPLLALNPHFADDMLEAVWGATGRDLPVHTTAHETADKWAAAARRAIIDRLS